MLLLCETERISVELKKPRKLVSLDSSRSNVPLTEMLSSDEQKIDESDDPTKETFLCHHLHSNIVTMLIDVSSPEL